MIYDEKIWLKHYDEGVPSALNYPKVPLYSFLEDSAANYPDNQALSYLGNSMSYSELDRVVNKAANALIDLDVKQGDRVALYLANTPQFIIMLYATLKIGAIAVPINPLYKSDEVSYQLNDSGAKTVVVMSRFYKVIQEVKSRSQLKNIIVTNVKEYFPTLTKMLFTLLKEKEDRVSINKSDYSLKKLLKKSSDQKPPIQVGPQDTALLQYTSGTTGTPKGVMLSHYALVANALQCRAWVTDTIEGEERVMGWLPFFHSFGMTACLSYTMSCAGTLILIPNPRDIKYILKTIQKEKVTIMPGVPTMYAALGHYEGVEKYDLSSVRACISGGAPLMENIQQRFVEVTGAKLVEGYGLSEASPVTHGNPMNVPNKANSIGVPFPDTQCKIVDLDNGKDIVEVGQEGELMVKGPQLMKGYWGDQKLSHETLQDGWLHTGDVVKMDEEGYFYVVDRKKDIIIVKGLNVSPVEVEKVCCTHPKVADAAIIGIPHEYKGEEIKAFIILKEGEQASALEIIAYIRSKLAPFKTPASVEFVNELPKNVMGKLLRRILLERELKKPNNGGNSWT